MYMCDNNHEEIVYSESDSTSVFAVCPCCEYLRQIKVLQEQIEDMSNAIDRLESKLFDFTNSMECPTKDFY